MDPIPLIMEYRFIEHSHVLNQLPTHVYQCRRLDDDTLDSTCKLEVEIQLSTVSREVLESKFRRELSNRSVFTFTDDEDVNNRNRTAVLSKVLRSCIVVDVLHHDYTIPTTYIQEDEEDESAIDGAMMLVPKPVYELVVDVKRSGVVLAYVQSRSLPVSSTHQGKPFRLMFHVHGHETLVTSAFLVLTKEPTRSRGPNPVLRPRGASRRKRRLIVSTDQAANRAREDVLVDAVEQLCLTSEDFFIMHDVSNRLIARLMYLAFCMNSTDTDADAGVRTVASLLNTAKAEGQAAARQVPQAGRVDTVPAAGTKRSRPLDSGPESVASVPNSAVPMTISYLDTELASDVGDRDGETSSRFATMEVDSACVDTPHGATSTPSHSSGSGGSHASAPMPAGVVDKTRVVKDSSQHIADVRASSASAFSRLPADGRQVAVEHPPVQPRAAVAAAPDALVSGSYQVDVSFGWNATADLLGSDAPLFRRTADAVPSTHSSDQGNTSMLDAGLRKAAEDHALDLMRQIREDVVRAALNATKEDRIASSTPQEDAPVAAVPPPHSNANEHGSDAFTPNPAPTALTERYPAEARPLRRSSRVNDSASALSGIRSAVVPRGGRGHTLELEPEQVDEPEALSAEAMVFGNMLRMEIERLRTAAATNAAGPAAAAPAAAAAERGGDKRSRMDKMRVQWAEMCQHGSVAKK